MQRLAVMIFAHQKMVMTLHSMWGLSLYDKTRLGRTFPVSCITCRTSPMVAWSSTPHQHDLLARQSRFVLNVLANLKPVNFFNHLVARQWP